MSMLRSSVPAEIGDTPLILAAGKLQTELVQLLLAKKVDPGAMIPEFLVFFYCLFGDCLLVHHLLVHH